MKKIKINKIKINQIKEIKEMLSNEKIPLQLPQHGSINF